MQVLPAVNAASRPTLRPVRDEDREFLRLCFRSAWQRAFAAASLSSDVLEKLLDHQFDAQDSSYRQECPDADFDLILIGGKPAGRIYVHRREQEIGLMEMTLLPEFRNQKIGTGLMTDLIEEAKAAGKSVVLHVEHWNPDARRLYLRLGFKVEQDIGTHWKMRWAP